MDIKELNKKQLILLTLLITFVVSIATGIVTVSLMQQVPKSVPRTINNVIQRTIEKVTTVQVPAPVKSISEKGKQSTSLIGTGDVLVLIYANDSKSINTSSDISTTTSSTSSSSISTHSISPDLTSYNTALNAVTEADYTTDSWTTYQTIVTNNVVTTSNTQTEVDAAVANIANAQANLVGVSSASQGSEPTPSQTLVSKDNTTTNNDTTPLTSETTTNNSNDNSNDNSNESNSIIESPKALGQGIIISDVGLIMVESSILEGHTRFRVVLNSTSFDATILKKFHNSFTILKITPKKNKNTSVNSSLPASAASALSTLRDSSLSSDNSTTKTPSL